MIRDVETIFFDLDGTLIDTKQLIIEAAWMSIKTVLPGSCKYEDVEAQFGMVPYLLLFKQLDPNQYDAMKALFYQHKSKQYDVFVTPFPFLVEGLKWLKGSDKKLAIITNQNKELTHYGLQKFQIDLYFDKIVTGSDVMELKPSPEGINKAIADLDVQPEHCLMVGDTKLDIVAAKQAGVRSVLLESYGAKDGFLEAVPDFKYPDFKSFAMEIMKEDE